MPIFVEVSRGMAIFGGIAAAYLPAIHAHPQMNPAITYLEAFLTALGVRFYMFDMVLHVAALSAHKSSPSISFVHDR